MFFTREDVATLLQAMKPAAREATAHVQAADYKRLVPLLEAEKRGRSGSKRHR
jgi:hypothetical protein